MQIRIPDPNEWLASVRARRATAMAAPLMVWFVGTQSDVAPVIHLLPADQAIPLAVGAVSPGRVCG